MRRTAGGHAHLSWLTFTRALAPHAPVAEFAKNVVVSLHHIEQGSVSGRLICRGKEVPMVGEAGFVRLHPADGDEQALVGRCGAAGVRYSTLLVPLTDFQSLADAEGLVRVPDLRTTVWANDPTLQKCLRVLTSPYADADDDRDEAARSLVLRVAELSNGGMPDWIVDTSGFTGRTLRHFVAVIDAHLRIPPTAADMAAVCGLSPGHFSRKFRHATGLSLQQFVNQRRVHAALDVLKQQSTPLSHAALDLGFSSQSHFTRLFRRATGMSPARYRRRFRPTVG